MQNKNLEALEHYKAFNKITTTDYFNIKYDLERLEVLEIDNKRLYEDIIMAFASRDKALEMWNNRKEENEKLKKAIEILKNKVSITVKIPYVWVETKDNCVYFKVNQQEYELLKEVLRNE